MNGRFVLDTNAVIALLNGDAGLAAMLKTATWVAIPIIVELEFLSFPNLSKNDEQLFQQFKSRVEVIGLDATNTALTQQIVEIRRNSGIKLPDAIIAATAIENNATLLSNDTVFQRLQNLSWSQF